MKLCDLHTHILPGVDDGAQTLEQARQMLQNAAASDVELVVLTPHCNVPGTSGNLYDAALRQRFYALQQQTEDIPVRLALGAEVHVTQQLPELLESRRIATINASRYVLTEFPFDFPRTLFPSVLEEILRLDYIPLVAHPERYAAVCRDPGIVEQWLDMGCHLQLTGGSILGSYGRHVQQSAGFLLRNDLVACVASDAHGVHRRSNFLLDVYDHLCVYYSRAYAQCLMRTNPMRICGDETL